ncbi:MAG: hypothetical protein ACD_62C00213G0003 [uncultured bacterium]|nr:MAG: hypothetical protein ACD_62C00213G0003 [uncultured bacterium]HLD44704.1 hypothetical protein [bacterium]
MKPYLLHLLMIPALVLLICNPFTYALAYSLSRLLFSSVSPFQSLAVFLVISYGAYLCWFRGRNPRDWVVLGISGVVALFWSFFALPFVVWMAGMILVFSIMRGLIMKKSLSGFGTDLTHTLVGAGAAVFLFPVGLSLSVGVFLIIQFLCDLRSQQPRTVHHPDRFYENLKTVKQILASQSP